MTARLNHIIFMQIRERRRDIAMHSVAIKFKKKDWKIFKFQRGRIRDAPY
jgi:cell fate regulator YaaT (PSP1 superfamily)